VWNTVNENSSILSILLLISQFISANVCSIFQLDLLCVGSTHLHGIRAEGLLSKRYTKFCFQVQKIEDNKKMDYSPKILLTPHNYLEWKPNIMLHIRSSLDEPFQNLCVSREQHISVRRT
jgi:hypothetical protein